MDTYWQNSHSLGHSPATPTRLGHAREATSNEVGRMVGVVRLNDAAAALLVLDHGGGSTVLLVASEAAVLLVRVSLSR